MLATCCNSSKTPRCFSNPWLQWSLAILVMVLIALLMTEYHRWRGRPWSILSFNKGLSISATIMLAWACSVGPLFRLRLIGERLAMFRRPAAICGAGGILIHVLLVFTFLRDRFGWSWVIENPLPAGFGAAAAIGVAALTVTSWPWAPRRLGIDRWLRLHSIARPALMLVAAHYLVLGKPKNWIAWAQNPDHLVPPGSVVPTLAITVALIIAGIARMKIGKLKDYRVK